VLETELQSITVKSIKAAGGCAHKLSNRFLTGVADLLVKLPEMPTALLEVKFNRYAVPLRIVHTAVEITVPQFRFLRDFHLAGMPTGVLSFAGKNCRDIWVTVLWFEQFRLVAPIGEHQVPPIHTKFALPIGEYVKLDPRTPALVEYITRAIQGSAPQEYR
jgi:hypothetical protein